MKQIRTSVNKGAGWLLACLAVTVPLPAGATAKEAKRRSVLVGGSWSGYCAMRAVGDAFQRASGISVGVVGKNNAKGFEYLATGKMDVLIHSPQPKISAAQAIAKYFPKGGPQPKRHRFGQFAVHVVVNKSDPIKQLSIPQLRAIFSGKSKEWRDVTGIPGGKITLIGELRDSKSREMLGNIVMGKAKVSGRTARLKNYVAVAAKVTKDKNAIGFCLYRQCKIGDVKTLAIGKTEKGPFYRPTKENVFEGTYPLIEELTLYTGPNASEAAKAFCKFACSEKATKIAKDWFLYPECDRQQYFAEKRLKQFKMRKGPKILAIGVADAHTLVRDLNLTYAEAKKVVQIRYAPADEMSAVGYFLTGAGDGSSGASKSSGMELLLLNGKPSRRAMKIHGKKWETLWLAANGSEQDVRPIEHVIGGRGVAIVVHSLNKLDSLTLDQVRAVFAGKVKDWNALTAAGAGEKDAPLLEVHRLGLKSSDPAAEIFHEKVLASRQCGRTNRKKDTAAVLAAMSIDPQGIAFVNFADLPADPDKSSIKILAIGPAGKAVEPMSQTIMDGSYPFSRRLHLYVSPKACDVTKDFVKFVLSGVCGETFVRNGLVVPTAKPVAPKAVKKK